jgi:hypothetical protein
MEYNPEKRLKKFTKNFFYFITHPMFNKLKKLYMENDVKQLRTIENWFNKMKFTKTGAITKKALGLVNKINELYSKYDVHVITTHTYTYEKLAVSMDLGFNQPIFFTQFKIWVRKQMKKWQIKYATNKFIINIKYYTDETIPQFVHDTYYLDFPTPNPEKNFYDYMENHYWDFMLGSGYFKVSKRDDNKIDTISFSPIDELNAVKTKQQFLDEGINKHCFLDPIVDWANDCVENSNTESTQKKYKAIINKIVLKWRPQFIKGFDENKIDDLCKDINVNIKVDLPFKNSNTQMIQSIVNKKPLKVFKYINTRFNHVNEIVSETSSLKKNIIIESYEEMNNIYNSYVDKNEFCICNKNITGSITKINTLMNIYTYNDNYINIVLDFENKSNINMFKLDYVKDFEVCNFINHSIHFNTVCQFKTKSNNLELDHIDQKKAYTQFKKCDQYIGFLGKITDFRKCDKVFALNNIGIYKIDNIKFFNDKMKSINDKMKIFINSCVYPSSDLLFLNKYASFDVIGGCYGIRFDFDFNDEMINNKVNDVAFYAKYVGTISKVNEYKNFYMNGSKKYFQNMLAYVHNTKVLYNDETKQARISYKKDYVPYKCHIASFILSYQRLHMLKQLMEMDIVKIIRVVTDGIYYNTHDFKINDTFRIKDVEDIEKLAFYNDCSNYLTNTNKYNDHFYNHMLDHHQINYYYGEAGTGKSYSLMNDPGFVKTLYISPPWKLSRQMKKDFKCDVSVLARVLNDTDELYFIKSNYNIIVFDECSQYTNNDKEIILKNFKFHKIFFVGDIGYQLPPAINKVMDINEKWYRKEFLVNHRIQCNLLRELCLQLRIFIKDGKTSEFINNYVLDKYSDKCFKSIDNYCHETDYILCSKNKCNKHHKLDCDCDGFNYALQWTNKYKNLNKYLVKSNSLTHCNGDIVFEKVPHSILCHAYSVHSVQGETMKNKIFIDMRNLFCPQMLYTAISRARKLEQIYFIV